MRSKHSLSVMVSVCLSVLLLVCSLTPLTASAKSVSELNNELADLQQEEAQINSKVNQLRGLAQDSKELKQELQAQVDNLQMQINLCVKSINHFDGEIQASEAKIAQKNTELDSSIEGFKRRIRAIAMGGNTEMAILLSADDFADFLAKTELTRSVSAYDQALMEKIKSTIADINAEKKEVEKKKSQQLSVKNTLAAKKKLLGGKVSSVNEQLSDIYDKTTDLKSQLAKIRAAQDQYEAAIKEAIRQAQQNNDVKYNGDKFAWPVKGFYKISSPYGWRTDPFDSSAREFHKGIDIAGVNIKGQPVLAAADGVVTTAGYNNYGYGYYVVLNHGKLNNVLYTTHYAHMQSVAVSVGQAVVKGVTVVGYVGTTGSSTGNHLHFEVRLNGSTVNPMNYFNSVK